MDVKCDKDRKRVGVQARRVPEFRATMQTETLYEKRPTQKMH